MVYNRLWVYLQVVPGVIFHNCQVTLSLEHFRFKINCILKFYLVVKQQAQYYARTQGLRAV